MDLAGPSAKGMIVSTPYGYGVVKERCDEADTTFHKVLYPWGYAHVYCKCIEFAPTFTILVTAPHTDHRLSFEMAFQLGSPASAFLQAVKKHLGYDDNVHIMVTQSNTIVEKRTDESDDKTVGESTMAAGPRYPLLVHTY